jgi:hypothetical protein
MLFCSVLISAFRHRGSPAEFPLHSALLFFSGLWGRVGRPISLFPTPWLAPCACRPEPLAQSSSPLAFFIYRIGASTFDVLPKKTAIPQECDKAAVHHGKNLCNIYL